MLFQLTLNTMVAEAVVVAVTLVAAVAVILVVAAVHILAVVVALISAVQVVQMQEQFVHIHQHQEVVMQAEAMPDTR